LGIPASVRTSDFTSDPVDGPQAIAEKIWKL